MVPHTSLVVPLTVDLGEFVGEVNAENRARFQSLLSSKWNGEAGHLDDLALSNPQALNRYAYTLNNPLQYTDPEGHSVSLAVIGVFALAGAVGSGVGYVAVQTALGNPIDPVELGVAVGVGAIAGALTPAASAAGLIGIGAGANAANEILPSLIKDEPIDPVEVTVSAGVGGITGGGSYLLGGSSDAVEKYMTHIVNQPLREIIGPTSAEMGRGMIREAFKEVAAEGGREAIRTAFWEFIAGVNVDSFTSFTGAEFR
jgi:hypothetical protein